MYKLVDRTDSINMNANTNMTKETFGDRVRQKRMEKQITLRKFADMVGISPTYVSQIERNEFKPPAEATIREISKILGEDEDEMLALANRVSSDLLGIIQEHPKEVATFLRTAKGVTREQWEELAQRIVQAGRNKKEKEKE